VPTFENGFRLAVAFVRRVDFPPTESPFWDNSRIRLENIPLEQGRAPMVLKLLPASFRKDTLKSQKPSKRIPMRIRFKVAGRDENGFAFEEYAESVDVSIGGGCLIFMKDIQKGEILRLYSPKGGLFVVSVRWFRYDMRKNIRYFGFQLAKPGDAWVLTNGETESSRSNPGA